MTEPRVPQRPNEPAPGADGSVSLLWLTAVLFRERRWLILCGAVGLVLGAALALFRPLTYTTNFSFLPQSEKDSRASLAGLATQFGIALPALGGGESQPPQFYVDLLSTREILGPIARDSVTAEDGRRVSMHEFLHVSGDDSALVEQRTMRKLSMDAITAVISGKTGVISVRVRTRSRDGSQRIAERLIERLGYFNLVTRQSQAREERRFTEGRLAEARAALRESEDNLLRFTESNRDISNSAAGALRRNRLQREVDMQQQIVTSLAQQYEENRIREVRNTPVLTVIEAPVPAPSRDSRHGVLILFLAVLAALTVGVLAVVSRDVVRRSRGRDPGLELLSAEWQRLRARRGAAAS